jgi:hypothetical protein
MYSQPQPLASLYYLSPVCSFDNIETLNFSPGSLPSASSEYTNSTVQRLFLITQKHIFISLILAFISVCWTIWRCWRFTLYPMLYPNELQELPYLIPSMYLSQTLNNNY